MNKWTVSLVALLFGLAMFFGTNKVSAEPPTENLSIQQLIERLEQAEKHIAELQGEAAQPIRSTIRVVSDEKPEKKKDDDQKTEKRIEELEFEVNKILGHFDKGTNWVHSGHSGSTMKISGRAHADYWTFPHDSPRIVAQEGQNPQDRVGFRRLRFAFSGDIKDNMFYKIELDFGTARNPVFKDAYIGFKDIPYLQKVTVGQQKRPYGLDHLNSSRYNVFMERPFIVEALNADARRLGITSQGISEDLAWNWRYGIYSQRDISGAAGGQAIDDHMQGEVAGRIANTIWYDESSGGRGYAHWALSGTVADSNGNSRNIGAQVNDTRFRTRAEARSTARWINTGRIAGANSFEILGTEAVVNVGSVQVVGEYMNLWVQRTGVAGRDVHFHGGYGYASYFLTGEHIPWDRKNGIIGRVKPFQNFFLVNRGDGRTDGGWGAWQVAARYSYADFSDANVLGGVGESVTLGVNWLWNPYASLQFNYINGRINQLAPVAGQTGGTYQIIGMRMRIDF